MPTPKKLAGFLTFLVAFCYRGYGQTDAIGVFIESPTTSNAPLSLQVVGDNLNIQVMVTATYQIDSVIASVDGQNVLLTYSGASSGWTGTLSLVGLPQDTTTLTVRAVDAYNNSGTATGQFIYDHPPTLAIDSPAAYTVALPNLHVRARCHSDSGACIISVVLQGSPNVTMGAYTNSCDVSYDLSSYEGLNANAPMEFSVQATDGRGVGSNAPWIPVYVETSPYLVPVFSADARIVDFSGNKVFAMQDGLISQPHITDLTSGSMTNIPFTGYIPSTGHLTSHGAVFQGESISEEIPGGWQNFFEWHDGTLDSLGKQTDPNTNVMAADYGIHSSTTNSIALRNFATQTDQTIANVSPYSSVGIAPTGTIVYPVAGPGFSETQWYLYHYGTGGSTLVKDDNTGSSVGSAVTDGTHIVYSRTTNYGIGSIIFASGGNYTDTLAIFPNMTNFLPGTYYQINNGYSAYLNPNSQQVPQVWIRDTTGKKMQITFFGSGSGLVDCLNPKGEVLYISPGQVISVGNSTIAARNIYTPTGGSIRISSAVGSSYYMDSAWYIVIGRTVFRVDVAITPDKSDNFPVNVKYDSSYGFTASSFASHFEGSGWLSKVVFTRLPAHGTLTVKGNPVFIPGTNTVLRASLQNLVYTPASGFTGIDTVNWYGSADFTTSVDTGMLLLNVLATLPPPLPPAPVQPVISGLSAVYCSNGGMAVFTMTNFPDTTAGTVVSDSLDGRPLSIGAGAGCSIGLSALGVGVHMVRVTYSNAGGSSSITQSFKVVAVSTPVVGISVSFTAIPATVASVQVRANAVSGGGSLPQYTFALNRNFTPVLYGPGGADTLIIDTAALAVGANTMYVRMQTSDSCYTVQSAMDSIVITRMADTSGHGSGNDSTAGAGGGGSTNTGTNDSTASSLSVGPNPFRDQLVISGLQSSHAYAISLLNGNGMEMVRTRINAVNKTSLSAGVIPPGVYLLRVYDETAGKTIRMIKLLALGN